MINLGIKVVQRPPSAEKIIRNINFGTAVGLTQTAKDGQAAVIGALKGTFTLRGRWFEQNMRHGIKITPAKRDKLVAEVKTLADWLEPHETGKDKTPRGRHVAVPSENVRRNKRLIIPRGQRPKNLKDAFVIETQHGPVLARRVKRGKNKGLQLLYGLERKVRIRKRSTFYEPIDKAVRRNLNRNVAAGIRKALLTMK
jgi:hypothetical protein